MYLCDCKGHTGAIVVQEIFGLFAKLLQTGMLRQAARRSDGRTGNGHDDLLLVTARCPRVGLKEDSPIDLSAQDFTGGLSPVRGHEGVRYAATSIARAQVGKV